MPSSKTDNNDESRSGKGDDAITLLKADHAAVKTMFKKYESLCENEDGDEEDKGELATRICQELTVHATIEEEIFYPALRKALDEQALLDEAEVEHASAKDLIGQIEMMGPEDELYDAKVIVLGEYISHHVEEEEGEMFTEARKAKVNMQALGAEMRARQQELKAGMDLADDEESDDDGSQTKSGNKTAGRQNGNRRAA